VTDSSKQDRKIIPVVEEKAVVLKRKKLTGGVRVRTVVREAQEIVDEPLATEDVEVERVVLDHWIDAPVPVRQEGETTIVTLVEEVVVVEKRLRAIAEVRISKRKSIRHAPQKITLRREEAVMERLTADGRKDDESF
jgi:stress response protein YsnF